MNPSERIDQLIAGLTDWRGKTFASIRKTILEADREITMVEKMGLSLGPRRKPKKTEEKPLNPQAYCNLPILALSFRNPFESFGHLDIRTMW